MGPFDEGLRGMGGVGEGLDKGGCGMVGDEKQ